MSDFDMVVYEKPTCTTCRGLVKLLEERGIPFERVDYMIDPIPRAKLVDLVRKMGGRPHDILRVKEASFRELGREASTMTDDEVLDLLAARPELVQRPIVERGEHAVLARPVESVEHIL